MQLKRPDPHVPEHHGDAENQTPAEPQDEIQLVSEPATCPFCKQPEFGVTYEAPSFRRGLVYAGQAQSFAGNTTPAMSSSVSLSSPGAPPQGRRRAESLAVTDRSVVTTDLVRPDWAKKLADAKSLAMRRSAAATALHTAAYMQGVLQQQESRGFRLGGRRRQIFGSESAGSSGQGTPRGDGEASSARNNEGLHDLFPGRHSSRPGSRVDELEELMMMEAIRLSLAAEEERKRKGERDAAKEAKKEEKKKAKELKKVAKAQKQIGSGFHPINVDGLDDSGVGSSTLAGKGKAVDRSGGSPFRDDSQRHLESSRAQIQREASGLGNSMPSSALDNEQSSHRAVLGRLSNPSSSNSSLAESENGSSRRHSRDGQNNFLCGQDNEASPSASGVSLSQNETPAQDTTGTEPMFNFQTLTDTITHDGDDKEQNSTQYIEHVPDDKPVIAKEACANSDIPESFDRLGNGLHTRLDDDQSAGGISTARHNAKGSPSSGPETSEVLDASVTTIKPADTTLKSNLSGENHEDEITSAPRVGLVSGNDSFDQKHIGDVSTMSRMNHQATQ